MEMNIKRPAIVIFLYVLYGIIAAYFDVSFLIFALIGILSVIVLIILFKDIPLRIIFVICILLSFVSFVHTNFKLDYKSALDSYVNNKVTFVGRICKVPVEKEKKTQLYVNDISFKDGNKIINTNDKILINVYYDNHSYKVGDYYEFSGKVKRAVSFDDFDYNLYLKTIGVYNYLNINKNNVSFVREGHLPLYLDKAFDLRDKFKSNLAENTDDKDNLNLLMGILFSDKSLNDDIKDNFNDTGLSHILAVSGLHVGLIYGFIAGILSIFAVERKYRVFIIAPLLFIYVMLAGMSVSATRAMILCLMNETLSLKHERDNDVFNHLFIIAIILLLFNPLNLFNVSFTLSFSAVVGILLMAPVIEFKIMDRFSENNKILRSIVSIFSVSICAYLFTIPVIINSFGSVSLISMVGNFVIVPLVAPIMIIGIIGGIFSNFIVGKIIINLLDLLLGIIRNIVSFLADLPFATVEIDDLNIIVIVAYYVFILFLGGYIKFFKKKKS